MMIEHSMGSEYSAEKKFFRFFALNSEASIGCVKVLSKEVRPQVKNSETFFLRSRSQRVLVGF